METNSKSPSENFIEKGCVNALLASIRVIYARERAHELRVSCHAAQIRIQVSF